MSESRLLNCPRGGYVEWLLHSRSKRPLDSISEVQSAVTSALAFLEDSLPVLRSKKNPRARRDLLQPCAKRSLTNRSIAGSIGGGTRRYELRNSPRSRILWVYSLARLSCSSVGSPYACCRRTSAGSLSNSRISFSSHT